MLFYCYSDPDATGSAMFTLFMQAPFKSCVNNFNGFSMSAIYFIYLLSCPLNITVGQALSRRLRIRFIVLFETQLLLITVQIIISITVTKALSQSTKQIYLRLLNSNDFNEQRTHHLKTKRDMCQAVLGFFYSPYNLHNILHDTSVPYKLVLAFRTYCSNRLCTHSKINSVLERSCLGHSNLVIL